MKIGIGDPMKIYLLIVLVSAIAALSHLPPQQETGNRNI
jgi:hypothetical protein